MKKKCTICFEYISLDRYGPNGRPCGSLHSQCNDCRNRKSREYAARTKKQNEEGYISHAKLTDYAPKEEISNFEEFDRIF